MKLIVLLLTLSITSAVADDATVTLPAGAVRKMIEENIALRKEVNALDRANDELFDKWRKRIGQVGECT